MPTPPVAPTTSTVAPCPSSTASIALFAVVPATPRDPACSSFTLPGVIASTAACGVARSPKDPSWIAGLLPILPKTRSPTAGPSTPSPTRSTTPATSIPTTAGNP